MPVTRPVPSRTVRYGAAFHDPRARGFRVAQQNRVQNEAAQRETFAPKSAESVTSGEVAAERDAAGRANRHAGQPCRARRLDRREHAHVGQDP